VARYLEDLRKHMKELKKKAKAAKGDRHGRKKEQKRAETKRQHPKVLIKYIDKDYADVKNRCASSSLSPPPSSRMCSADVHSTSLYPMLENGLITFDLLWALWKPNTLAFTTTYGSHDEPRVFKVEMAERHHGLMRGGYYYIEGKVWQCSPPEGVPKTPLCGSPFANGLRAFCSTSSMMGSSSASAA
jgi:hypothetical protein